MRPRTRKLFQIPLIAGPGRPLTLNLDVSKSNWGFAPGYRPRSGLPGPRRGAYEFRVGTHQICSMPIRLYCWALRLHKVCKFRRHLPTFVRDNHAKKYSRDAVSSLRSFYTECAKNTMQYSLCSFKRKF